MSQETTPRETRRDLEKYISRTDEEDAIVGKYDDVPTAAHYKDRKFFRKSWRRIIRPDTTDIEYIDTVPMPAGNEELDTVDRAPTLEAALREYDKRYSLENVDSGEQSPQLAAEMLIGITNKFGDTMKPEQRRAVALETIEMGEAIIRLADKPAEKSREWTSVKGLMELGDIIALAQTYAPEKVDTLKKGLKHVAETVETRAPAISNPIKVALDEFDRLPDDQKKPFDDILEQIERAELSAADEKYMERRAQLDKEREESVAKERKAIAEEKRLALRNARISQELAETATGLNYAPATGMAMSLEDLEADEKEDSQLVGMK